MKQPRANDVRPMRAVLYTRAAREPGAESVARQEEACRAYAARHGLDVVGVFTDRGPAPSRRAMPPGYRALLAAAVRERAAAMVVWDHARLGRNASDSLFVREEIAAHGLRIGTACEMETVPAFPVSDAMIRGILDHYSEQARKGEPR
jgi:DNA invertase Pin-like site-specific DNA recombinase